MNDPLAHVLAKSADKTRGRRAETLTGHTADVLYRLVGWMRRYPDLPTHALREDLWTLAAWSVVLHDVGKVARGFQERLRGENAPPFDHRHEVLSLVVVGALELEDSARALVAAGVATHHKDLSAIQVLYDEYGRDDLLEHLEKDDEERVESWLASEARGLLEKHGFSPFPARRAVGPRQALDTSFRALHALGRALRNDGVATTPLNLAARAMRGLVVLADHAGSAHEKLPSIPSLDSPTSFVGCANEALSRGLSHHQHIAAETKGHAILVAPTGSGKTEAALLWAAHQRELGPGKPVVFYVLPYRASLNAMRERIEKRYHVAKDAIVLQHAKATSALYSSLLEKKYEPKHAEHLALRERSLGRLMTAPLRVLTPYQLLRAIFGLRGHEAMLTDAAGGLFVFDELHAYDRDRLGLILAATRHLARDCGARVFAMSATMPTVLRSVLVEALGAEPTAIEADDATKRQFRRHQLHVVDRDLFSEETMADVERRFRAGEAVLVVASTVARAQRFYDEARAQLGIDSQERRADVSLLHSRFMARDRNQKEAALAARLSTKQRVDGATLVVSTQVVEVSLDVDFDVLFTDPAPMEALLQRFGRVNRGLRGGLRDVVVHAHPPQEAVFYPPSVIARTLDVLRRSEGAVDEAALQGWVDDVYAPTADAWIDEVRRKVETALRDVVEVNWPLETQELDAYFDQFDEGFEVVPARHSEEHARLLSSDPLKAADLLVPVSGGQLRKLRGAGRLSERVVDKTKWFIAHVPYDPERGLSLDALSASLGD